MGFEDEAEQSKWRPYRQCNGRSKRTYELTSSIVPRGTSFHGLVELEIPPIVFVYLRPHATTARTQPGGARRFSGRRQPWCDGTSRMMREYQVRICERLRVKSPGPTRQSRPMHSAPV